MKILIFCFLICCSGFVYSQTPAGNQLVMGGQGTEAAASIIQTSDGGYAVGGYYNVAGGDFYVLKVDSARVVQWTIALGGSGYDLTYKIIQTSDGGYAVVGTTRSYGVEMYIFKLNENGTLLWNKIVGGSGDEQGYSIVETADSGYIAAGFTDSYGAGGGDMFLVKLNSSGVLQWAKTIGGPSYDDAHSIIRTTDGGYAVFGITESYGAGSGDFCIVKLDSACSFQWSRTLGRTNYDVAQSIIQTTDGGYAVTGYFNIVSHQNDFCIAKFEPNGAYQWSKIIGGPFNDDAISIVQTVDGGYAAAGYTGSFGLGDWDMFVVKLDAGSNFQWGKTIGGTSSDRALSVINTPNGFTVAGGTHSFGAGGDIYVVQFDTSGNTCSNFTVPSSQVDSGGTSTVISPTVNTVNPNISSTPPGITYPSATVTQVCNTVGIINVKGKIPGQYKLYQNYPNPFNPSTSIKFDLPLESYVTLKIYDQLGREIAVLKSEHLRAGTHEVEWDASNYPSGIYFYKLISGNYAETKRMVLLK